MKEKTAEGILKGKIKDASNTNTIFDTRKYVLYDDALSAMHEYAAQSAPKWVELYEAFAAGYHHASDCVCGECDFCLIRKDSNSLPEPDFETWYEKKYGHKPELPSPPKQ